MIGLCDNITGIIESVQKGGHLLKELKVINILDLELNPDGCAPFVRVIFQRNKNADR